jgi:hypothetical protein
MNILTDKNLKKEYTNKLLNKLQKRRVANLKLRDNELKNKSVQCSGMNIVNDHLERCTNISNKKYCDKHEERYRYEKPEDCPVCMDTISEEIEIPLMCGHWVHKMCLVPTNIHICPVCRQKMQQDEVNYVFGAQHRERNLYAHNYSIPFNPQQIIMQNHAGIFMRDPNPNPNPNQMNNPITEEETLQLHMMNNPSSRVTIHEILGLLRQIVLRVNNNIYTYISSLENYPQWSWSRVPELLTNRVNILRDILFRRCFSRSRTYHFDIDRIRNEIERLPEQQKLFLSRLFSLIYNISLVEDLNSDIHVENAILKLVKATMLKLGLVR